MNEQNEVFTKIVTNILYWFLNLHILPDPSYFIFFVINFSHENTEYKDPKNHKYTIPMPKDTKNTNQKTKSLLQAMSVFQQLKIHDYNFIKQFNMLGQSFAIQGQHCQNI